MFSISLPTKQQIDQHKPWKRHKQRIVRPRTNGDLYPIYVFRQLRFGFRFPIQIFKMNKSFRGCKKSHSGGGWEVEGGNWRKYLVFYCVSYDSYFSYCRVAKHFLIFSFYIHHLIHFYILSLEFNMTLTRFK